MFISTLAIGYFLSFIYLHIPAFFNRGTDLVSTSQIRPKLISAGAGMSAEGRAVHGFDGLCVWSLSLDPL